MTTKSIEAGARADLLPCPFCNSDDIIIADNVEVWGQESDQVYARCNKCGANGPSAYTDQSAFAKWGKRVAIASGELVPATKSAPVGKASHNTGERDPSVMSDCSGADASTRLAVARAICRSDDGPGVPSCVMDDHPEREPCNETNCRRFDQADAAIKAIDIQAQVDRAVAAERERCAAICDERAIKLRAKAKSMKQPHSQHYFGQAIEARVIAEAIRALEPASGEYVLGWRTMDTAPKDGTIILLWYPWTGADLEGAPDGFMYLARWTYKEDGSEAWIDPTDDDEIGDGAIRWMPRPTPPPLTAATSNGSGK